MNTDFRVRCRPGEGGKNTYKLKEAFQTLRNILNPLLLVDDM